MTEQERQEVKVKLIELGFWGAEDQGDPTHDDRAAGTLSDRLQAKLAEDVLLTSIMVVGRSQARCAMVVDCEHSHELAIADTYPESICLAALALPEFLIRHPECVGNKAEEFPSELDTGCDQ